MGAFGPRYHRRVRAALALAAIVWLTLLILAPVLPVPMAGIVYALGSRICHQRPERSFHLFAAQLPVCARCVGIYAGAAIGSLLAQPRTVRRNFSNCAARSTAVGAPGRTRAMVASGIWARFSK